MRCCKNSCCFSTQMFQCYNLDVRKIASKQFSAQLHNTPTQKKTCCWFGVRHANKCWHDSFKGSFCHTGAYRSPLWLPPHPLGTNRRVNGNEKEGRPSGGLIGEAALSPLPQIAGGSLSASLSACRRRNTTLVLHCPVWFHLTGLQPAIRAHTQSNAGVVAERAAKIGPKFGRFFLESITSYQHTHTKLTKGKKMALI